MGVKDQVYVAVEVKDGQLVQIKHNDGIVWTKLNQQERKVYVLRNEELFINGKVPKLRLNDIIRIKYIVDNSIGTEFVFVQEEI